MVLSKNRIYPTKLPIGNQRISKKMKNQIQNPKEKRMLDDFKMIFVHFYHQSTEQNSKIIPLMIEMKIKMNLKMI